MRGETLTIRKASVKWLTSGAVGVALLLGSALASAPAQAGDCDEVAQSQLKACRNSALDEYWVAIAICDNDAADDPKGLCPKAASQQLTDARLNCADQLDSRTQICARLGGGKYNPVINPANFSTSTIINNPYYPLKPGTTFIYEGDTANGRERDEFQVTRRTHTFLGVKCVEVHDVVTVDGELTEDTLDWFAQDKAGNVWYFGEESKQVEDGIVIGIEGSWQSGAEEAKPGIIMKAKPKLGDVYRQEYAIANEAEDMAEVAALGQTVHVNGKTYNNVLVTHEFSAQEPSASERKFYAPGVGNVLVIDDEAGETSELIKITTN
jgi:hypothetical protein